MGAATASAAASVRLRSFNPKGNAYFSIYDDNRQDSPGRWRAGWLDESPL
jgi:hypothetical protein